MANKRCRCLFLQTGPRTIVFGSDSDRELRIESLAPEREKEDTWRIAHTPPWSSEFNQPLIGIPFAENGHEVI